MQLVLCSGAFLRGGMFIVLHTRPNPLIIMPTAQNFARLHPDRWDNLCLKCDPIKARPNSPPRLGIPCNLLSAPMYFVGLVGKHQRADPQGVVLVVRAVRNPAPAAEQHLLKERL